MKRLFVLPLAALALLVPACATNRPPAVFHNTDQAALIVQSLDGSSARLVMPTPTGAVQNTEILERAKNLSPHQTAVIILENYPEPKPGAMFRDRSLGWFMALRSLGYQRIFFLQGNGLSSPEGLITLAEYD